MLSTYYNGALLNATAWTISVFGAYFAVEKSDTGVAWPIFNDSYLPKPFIRPPDNLLPVSELLQRIASLGENPHMSSIQTLFTRFVWTT
jgi:hypothetical protein